MKYIIIILILIIIFVIINYIRKKFRKYYYQSMRMYLYYRVKFFFKNFKPATITSEDYFSEGDYLFGKTDCRVIGYGDISNANPKKFLYALLRGGGTIVISNVKKTNCYFSLDTAGHVDMLGLLIYCSDKKWIEFETYNIGDKIYFHDKNYEPMEYETTRKLAKITMLNRYKFYEDMKVNKNQRWIYFIQIIGFILVFSVSLATLLKT